MGTVLGTECNVWLVAGLLVLALGLATALLFAVRSSVAGTRRTR